MAEFWLSPPDNSARYMLTNVHVPPRLCALEPNSDGWCLADIQIENGMVTGVFPSGSLHGSDIQCIDARRGILYSALVDCHTHVDKAHAGAFTVFPPGDLAAAIGAMIENKQTWTRASVDARVEFSLASAYAYGVRAMRSHVDFVPDSPAFIYEAMRDTRDRWAGRIDLQLSPLAGIDAYSDPQFRQIIFDAAETEGRFGTFLFDQPNLEEHLTPLFEEAGRRGWDLDFHVDEGADAGLNGLEAVANVALATGFGGTVLCGHCVALGLYEPERRDRVIELARTAGLHFVVLPASNLYLQSRHTGGVPTLRGMGPVGLLEQCGLTVSVGADNVRDAFCAFGDFDPASVLNLAAQVGHLHEPARDWSALVTTNPAASMGLDWDGTIMPGAPADLVLFAARNSGEMNLRSTPKRIVIRDGAWLDIDLPNFSELDE